MYARVARYAMAIVTVIGLQSGCSTSMELARGPQPMSVPAAAAPAAPAPSIAPTVLTKDGTLYRLDHYRLTDSRLLATGTMDRDGQPRPFKGQLALGDIGYARAESHVGLGKALLATGAVVAFAVLAVSSLNDAQPGVSVQEVHGYHAPPSYGGGGYSCPLVYSYDGRAYHLESETYAGALFKGAERASVDNLAHLQPVGGHYRLKLANESSETEYVNELALLAVDAAPGLKVVPDARGDFHTIAQPVAPIRCVDEEGRDALSAVREQDDQSWESDLGAKDLGADQGLRDGLVLEFPRPRGAGAAKLVVHGINTTLGDFAFGQLSALKGEGQLRWYQRLEQDPAERRKLIAWMKREGMLHIQVWQDGAWVEQTALPDVGPRVSKDQVAVLDLSRIAGDTVRLRLESATDLWRIDRVYLDYSADQRVEVTHIHPATVVDETGHDVTDLVRRDDDRYYVTVKGQSALVTFDEVPAPAGVERHYAVRAKGYYQRWSDDHGKEQTALADRILTEPLYGSRLLMSSWKSLKAR